MLSRVLYSATIAALVSGEIADRIGRQLTLFGALAISFIAVALEFIAVTPPVFFAGKLLNGLMVGTVGTIMVGYIGEVCLSKKLPDSLPRVFTLILTLE